MGQHVGVHGRRHEHRRSRGEVEGGKKIVGDTIGKLADHVRRRGCDHQQRDVGRELDVLDIRVRATLELVGDDPPVRDGLEGQRPDELRRGFSQNGDHLVTVFLKPTRDFHRLVGADPARHAESNQ